MSDSEIAIDLQKRVISAFIFDPAVYAAHKNFFKNEWFAYSNHDDVLMAMSHLYKAHGTYTEHQITKYLEKRISASSAEMVMLSIMTSVPATEPSIYLPQIENYYKKMEIRRVLIKEIEGDNSADELIEKLIAISSNTLNQASKVRGVENILEYKRQNELEMAEDFHLLDYLPIPKGELTIIAGDGDSGKSMLSIVLAIKLAMQNKRTLIWLSEDGAQKIANRFHLICDEVLGNVDKKFVSKNIRFYDRSERVFHITNDRGEPTLEFLNFKKEAQGYDMVILDPLVAFISNIDENGNTQLRGAIQYLLEWLGEASLLSLVVLHHAPAAELKARGGSAIRDAARLLYLIEPFFEHIKDEDGKTAKDSKGKERIKKIFPHLRKVYINKDNHNATYFIQKANPHYDETHNYLKIKILPIPVEFETIKSDIIVSREEAFEKLNIKVTSIE